MIQGGAGTSTNMNANEVIANRALEHLGHHRGEYQHLHPLQDVNLGQSTNDVYPTAINIALDTYIVKLDAALGVLHAAFLRKAAEFADVIKMGRTQLQDAVPMTLGQEFAAYAITLAEDRQRLREARLLLHELNLGGTAIGTELNAHPEYRRHVIDDPARDHRHPDPGLRGAIWSRRPPTSGHFVQLSGVLKRVAVKLSKTCNDLRLLSSGPRAGFGEINLPARQAGSIDHAGQGEPGDPRGGQPGRLRGDRQRRHRDPRRRERAAAAQRLRADHRALAVRQPGSPGGGRGRPGGQVHRRHHRQPRTAPRRGSRTRSVWSPH